MAIGLAYGARKINVPFKSNLAIAVFSGLATLISAALGNVLLNIIPDYIGQVVGGSIVAMMGMYTVVKYFLDKRKTIHTYEIGESGIDNLIAVMEDPVIADKDFSGDISLKESILLGIALAVNCLGTGFGAGMAGVNIFILSSAVVCFSLLTISMGALLGKKFASRFLGERAIIISGVILLLVGLYEIFF
jgi:putative sporulation protein YtaF